MAIFSKSKGKAAEEQLADNILRDISITKNHQKLALEILLPELKDTVLKPEETYMLPPEAISRIGIVQYVDDKPRFIHRTFAEYYVADILAKELTKETRFLLEVLNMLFQILLGKDYAVIRFFLDGLLVNPKKTQGTKQYGKKIYEIWKEKESYKISEVGKKVLSREKLETALLKAAKEGTAHIINFF